MKKIILCKKKQEKESDKHGHALIGALILLAPLKNRVHVKSLEPIGDANAHEEDTAGRGEWNREGSLANLLHLVEADFYGQELRGSEEAAQIVLNFTYLARKNFNVAPAAGFFVDVLCIFKALLHGVLSAEWALVVCKVPRKEYTIIFPLAGHLVHADARLFARRRAV